MERTRVSLPTALTVMTSLVASVIYRVRPADFLFLMAFHIQKRKLSCYTLYVFHVTPHKAINSIFKYIKA
jgi:hypothetical protein